MRSVHGWILLAVAGMTFWLGWVMRFFSSAWLLFVLAILAATFGISDMRRHDRDGSSIGPHWDD